MRQDIIDQQRGTLGHPPGANVDRNNTQRAMRIALGKTDEARNALAVGVELARMN